MALQLFDLAGKNEALRFSPFCWRAKMALRHKGLECEELPWRFTEKERLAATGQGRVPVLVDDGRWVNDSWAIARYLDETYPDRPALMATPAARAGARFLNIWADTTLHPALRPILLLAVYNAAAEKDRGYLRTSREELVGMPLEQYCADREGAIASLQKVLTPVEQTLGEFSFLGGDAPNFADYIVFGSLQWTNVLCPVSFLASGSSVERWFETILDMFDGYARNAPTLPKSAAA